MAFEIRHEGVKRRSGRYPWGSGEQPFQSEGGTFLKYVKILKDEGLSEKEIADAFGVTVQSLREKKSVLKDQKRAADAAMAINLRDKGYSNVAIGERMGINESSVRALLDPSRQERALVTKNVMSLLKDNLEDSNYLDVGLGVEAHLGISRTKLLTAVNQLKKEGYVVSYVKVPQVGTNESTSLMVLSKPGTEYKDVYKNISDIQMPGGHLIDGGLSINPLVPPRSVNSSRISIAYNSNKDGVIELRRGVEDIQLGNAKYAQVRIAVDGTHFLKGMAMYSDDLPDGVDIRFNTNKDSNVPKMEVLKPLDLESKRPFGAVPRQTYFINKKGEKELSAINILNEEGDWTEWTKSLASQMVSKQLPSFAKKQLDKAYQMKKEEYDEIMELTNPAIKQKLLGPFSDNVDAAAVHLKAAGMPRQAWAVILPFNKIKEDEVYAPNHIDGETVVLVRYPHGGIFEIPRLKVNNKNSEAKNILGQAKDAIGINPKVAEKLSGADFDGDTVLIIPDNSKAIKNKPYLEALKNFSPREKYKQYEGMPILSEQRTQTEMGIISNLITDMTIKGASDNEIARAVKHSMVVIDANKHKLNYKQSEIDNNISELKLKYQDKASGGASTLLSKATSDVYLNQRTAGKYVTDPATGKTKKLYVDPETGKKLYTETGKKYSPIDKKGRTEIDPVTGKIKYLDTLNKEIAYKTKSKKLAEESDAFNLSSGTAMENVYAAYSNKLKALANEARLAMINIKPKAYSPSARKTYQKEVTSLMAKLNEAIRNKPLERKAQALANALIKAQKDASKEKLTAAELKKIKGQALEEARNKVGAKKQQIDITLDEWIAIQAGAVSHTTTLSILDNANLDKVKELATPRKETPKVSTARLARAKTMLNAGHTQAEVAAALGMSLTTIQEILG